LAVKATGSDYMVSTAESRAIAVREEEADTPTSKDRRGQSFCYTDDASQLRIGLGKVTWLVVFGMANSSAFLISRPLCCAPAHGAT
jgi:hypothetical protein